MSLKRQERITVYLDEAEKAIVQFIAEQEGMSMGAVLRRLIHQESRRISYNKPQIPRYVLRATKTEMATEPHRSLIAAILGYRVDEIKADATVMGLCDWVLRELARVYAPGVEILKLRFGLKDGKKYMWQDIAGALNVSRERVRLIERKALRYLRHPRFRRELSCLLIDADLHGDESVV